MIDSLAALVVDESKWLTASMAVAMVATAVRLRAHVRAGLPTRPVVLAAMSLFAGLTIGLMAIGHLLAVTVKLATGTLAGNSLVFYGVGIALAAPSWALVHHALRPVSPPQREARTLTLNAWLGLTLLAFGLHNLPLAAPAWLTVGYVLHTRRVVGWTLVGVSVLVGVGLFVGSLVFLASGQTFEQFRGIE